MYGPSTWPCVLQNVLQSLLYYGKHWHTSSLYCCLYHKKPPCRKLRPVWESAGSQPLVPETPSDQDQHGADSASASGSGVTVSWGTGPSTEWPSRPRFDRSRCVLRRPCPPCSPSEWEGMQQRFPDACRARRPYALLLLCLQVLNGDAQHVVFTPRHNFFQAQSPSLRCQLIESVSARTEQGRHREWRMSIAVWVSLDSIVPLSIQRQIPTCMRFCMGCYGLIAFFSFIL